VINGLDTFRKHFAEHGKSFVLIGGVACHEWLAEQGLQFRATKDIDIVLLIELIDKAFIAHFWRFIEQGKYQVREKAAGGRELYRFSKPQTADYPAMLELFSRKAEKIDLAAGQRIIPIEMDENSASLSAILLDDTYYSLIREQASHKTDLPLVSPAALIPLKARAWLDLTERQKKGERIDSKDIAKHRADIFRLGATLPGEPGAELPEPIQQDLKMFIASFPATSDEWTAILDSLKTTFPNLKLEPAQLVQAIQTFFRLA
jgi:hypothetical protein